MMGRHSRKGNQSSRAAVEQRDWRRRMVLICLMLMAGFASYNFVPQAIAGWTTIQHVSISGVKLMKRGEILSLLALPPESNLWTVDSAALQKRLTAHPRIASVSVGRALPHTLAVVIHEREPAAAFQHAGGQLFVDEEGVVLSIAPDDHIPGLPRFSGLSAIRLLEGEPATRERVRMGVMVAKLLRERFAGEFHIDLGDASEIVAGTKEVTFLVNQDIQQAWQQYLALEPTIRTGLPTGPYEIDLRYSDKVIVRERTN